MKFNKTQKCVLQNHGIVTVAIKDNEQHFTSQSEENLLDNFAASSWLFTPEFYLEEKYFNSDFDENLEFCQFPKMGLANLQKTISLFAWNVKERDNPCQCPNIPAWLFFIHNTQLVAMVALFLIPFITYSY